MSVDTSRTTALSALVIDRRRCCSTQCVSSIAFQMTRSAETSAPLIQARRPDPASTITISWRLDGFRRPPHRDQIAIGRRIFPVSASRGFLPWTLSDDGPSACRTVAIGRRPKPFTTAELWCGQAGTAVKCHISAQPQLK